MYQYVVLARISCKLQDPSHNISMHYHIRQDHDRLHPYYYKLYQNENDQLANVLNESKMLFDDTIKCLRIYLNLMVVELVFELIMIYRTNRAHIYLLLLLNQINTNNKLSNYDHSNRIATIIQI